MKYIEDERVHRKLLELMYQQNVRACSPIFLIQLMIAILLAQSQPLEMVLVWFGLSMAYKAIHRTALPAIQKKPSLGVRKELFLVSIFIVLSGSVLAGCLVFFNSMPIIDRILLTMTLLAVVSGANGTFAGNQRLFWCYITPIVAPLSLLWFFNVSDDFSQALSIWVGILVLIASGIMSVVGQDTFKFFSKSIKHIDERDQLTRKLIEALNQQELSKKNAERSNQSKTRLLAAVSHDLRQPVHVLNLFGEALKKSESQTDSKDIIDSMQLAINDLSQQINVLLDITKLDEISYKPEIKELCTNNLMDIVTKCLRVDIDQRGLKLIVQYSEIMYVMSDPQLLQQILRNLVGNAIKYTTEGQITISLKSDGDDVLMSVEDTGIGIAETELAAIFEEYYQINNPERNHKNGLGLGLSIVERAADLMGHSVTAESTLGSGSKFTIRMKREYPKMLSMPSLFQTPDRYELQDVKLRVHVVDDDLMVCEGMRSALEAMHCDVSTTHSTEATSEYFSSHQSPDLFIIDIRLQGEDSGFKTRQYAKTFHPQAKCVYISGEQHSKQQVRDIGNTQLIRKPINGEQLKGLLAETQIDVRSKSETIKPDTRRHSREQTTYS